MFRFLRSVKCGLEVRPEGYWPRSLYEDTWSIGERNKRGGGRRGCILGGCGWTEEGARVRYRRKRGVARLVYS